MLLQSKKQRSSRIGTVCMVHLCKLYRHLMGLWRGGQQEMRSEAKEDRLAVLPSCDPVSANAVMGG